MIEVGSTCCRHFLTAGSSFFLFPFFDGPPSRNSDCGNFEFITKLFYNPLQSKHDIFLSERFRIIFIQDEEKNVGDDRTVYKAVNISSTPAKEVVGKYYEVVKVWTKTDYLSAGCCLLLREKESGEEMYYNPFRYPLSMTCLGYYEKLKRFVGQTFLSLAKRVETEDGQVITPAEGAEYRCVDVGLKMNSDGAFLLMEGADGVRVEAFPIGGDEVYEFVSTARIGQLEKLYGEKYGKLIAFRKVDTGMTREMVIAAWGEPYHKSEVKKEGRTLETLRFSNDRCVELLDGKVQYVHVY